MKYVLDTNILIYFMDGALTPGGFSFVANAMQTRDCLISVITKIEVLGFQFPTSNQEQKAEKLVLSLPLGLLSDAVVSKTIEIRKLRKIKVADGIIAASAILEGMTLVSRNEKDFKNLPGLNLINPFDL